MRRLLAALTASVAIAALAGGLSATASAEVSIAEATATALTRAQKLGTIESYTASATTLGAAQASTSLEPASGPVESPVVLLIAHGHFVDQTAVVPPGTTAPTGTVLSLTVDRQTGFVVELHLTNPLTATAAKGTVARAKAATWGRDCKQESYPENHHCYAIGDWSMTGGEMVAGTLAIQDVTDMVVPGWASGDVVTSEEWTQFEPAGYWVEAGVEAGAYRNCCNLWPFFAHDNAEGYEEYVAPWDIEPGYGGPENEPYFQMNAAGGGVWYTYWWGHLVDGVGGFSVYSNDLKVGVEIAAETKPEVATSIADNDTWTNGTIHNWNRVAWLIIPEGSGMCIGANGKAPAVGNISAGTC
jgi:hypothetical protein